ncbi:MAG: hypothetical protein Fues2KO_17990 [Fuerstiella sp.]
MVHSDCLVAHRTCKEIKRPVMAVAEDADVHGPRAESAVTDSGEGSKIRCDGCGRSYRHDDNRFWRIFADSVRDRSA